MGKLNWWKTACAVFLLCAATAIALPAQAFTVLHSFDGTDGANPYSSLTQATDGNLYGTTSSGGALDSGTIFKVSPTGAVSGLLSFCNPSACKGGGPPFGALVQASTGSLFGTAGPSSMAQFSKSRHAGS